jgi:hypothetical protein
MQISEESYLTDYNSYTTAVTGASSLATEGFVATASGPTDTVVNIVTNKSWCLKSVSASGTSWYLGSATQGPTTSACTTS